ncbi:Conserved_hypothetical protein [Hexamita inflata]|uniref:Uncharacterized protein n=1 Tax=Hexamita inflata TaxID=28002 RepID=A0AA86UUM2_9EUKA|nr:Conserved hypothetical protein [Hexamita inflata]
MKIGTLIGQLQSNQTDMQNISVLNSTICNSNISGGLVGLSQNSIKIQSCIITINISSKSNCGGIIGESYIFVKIQNCKVIDSILSSYYTGGYIGQLNSSIQFIKCSQTSLTIQSTCNAGGLIAITTSNNSIQIDYTHIENINIEVILTQYSAAGLIGVSSAYVLVNNSKVQNIKILSLNTAALIGYQQQIYQQEATFNQITIVNINLQTQFSSGLCIGLLETQVSARHVNISITIQNKSIRSSAGFVGKITSNNQYLSQFVNSSICESVIISQSYVGGIIGETMSNIHINNCSTNKLVLISDINCAGFIGSSQSLSNIDITQSIIQNSSILSNGDYSIGGIIGITISNVSITNITIKYVNITAFFANISGAGAAGIIGKADIAIIINCSVEYTIINSVNQASAGLVGYSQLNLTIINCSINNSVINNNNSIHLYSTGGIIGVSNNTVLIDNCMISNCTMDSITFSGSFIGMQLKDSSIQILNSQVHTIQMRCKQCGIISGTVKLESYTVKNSQSFGQNYINGNIMNNCVSFDILTNMNGC